MIKYSIITYFKVRWKKWIKVTLILFFIFTLLRRIIPDVFNVPSGGKLKIWDFVFSCLSEPIIFILVIPILYVYLISDIIISDCKAGYINFILSRSNNRVEYFLSKVIIILLTSNLFILLCLIILVSIGMLYRMPFAGGNYNIVYIAIKSGEGVLGLLAKQYGLMVLELQFMGTFMIIMSLVLRHSIYNYIILFLFILESHRTIFNSHKRLPISVLSQSSIYFHIPYHKYVVIKDVSDVPNIFTVQYSTIFLVVLISICIAMGCIRVKKMCLSSEE